MAAPPLVSVIIPCYNRADFLCQCLESVAQQTYPNIEVIVVDDASEEDLSAAVRRFPNFHTIRLEQNSGPGAAREIGRQAAQGAFICYLDADDWWNKDKVSVQVQAMQENPGAGMCYCTTKEFLTLPLTGAESIRALSDRAFSRFLPTLLQGNRQRPWATPASMWARWATDLIGPWFPGRHWEDMEYECRAGCFDIPIVFVPQTLCYCRKGPGRLSGGDWKTRGIKQTPALLEIARVLVIFGKTEDDKILDNLLWLLYDHGMLLLKAGERTLAEQCLRRLIDICPDSRRSVFYTRLVLSIPSTRLSWVLGRGLRKYFSQAI